MAKSSTPAAKIEQRVAVLGTGQIGGIILRALLKAGLGADRVFPTVRHPDRATELTQQLSVAVGTDNHVAARAADVILIAVKPQTVREVLEEIRPEMTPDKLLVSVAASVPTAYMEDVLMGRSPWCGRCRTRPAPSGSG